MSAADYHAAPVRICECGRHIRADERAATLRPWSELGLHIYECPACGSTLSHGPVFIHVYTQEQYAERARLIAAANGWREVARRVVAGRLTRDGATVRTATGTTHAPTLAEALADEPRSV